MSRRRKFLLGTVGTLALAGGGTVGYKRFTDVPPRAKITPTSGKKLNVLFILTDQERSWAQLPAGFIEKHCPNRAWLQANGVSITRANTITQMCSMARGGVYTGTHSPNNGLWDNVPLPYAEGLRRTVPTMGTVFQDAGYHTGYTGKWHLTHMVNEHDGADIEKMKRIVVSYGFNESGIGGETDGALVGMERDGVTAERSVEFIQRNKNAKKPWMLAVNLLNPHDVMYYTAGEKMTQSRVSQFPDKTVRPPTTGVYARDLGYDVIGSWGPATRATKPSAVVEFTKTMDEALGHMPYDDVNVAREFQNYYWNCIRDCDRHLGTVLKGLRDSGQLQNTVIVLTSDHGEFLGVHGLRGKGSSIYREASEVPFVIVHPDGKKGESSNSLVSSVDVIPTLLGLCGLDYAKIKEQLPMLAGYDHSALAMSPQSAGARSQTGLLAYWTGLTYLNHEGVKQFDEIRQRAFPTRMTGLAGLIRENINTKRGAMRGIITEQFKFARYFTPLGHNRPPTWEQLNANNDLELYDLTKDPKEITNVASNPAYKDQVLAMNQKLNALIDKEIGLDDGKFLPILMRL
jgi:arylsulfatase A-like enzyme